MNAFRYVTDQTDVAVNSTIRIMLENLTDTLQMKPAFAQIPDQFRMPEQPQSAQPRQDHSIVAADG